MKPIVSMPPVDMNVFYCSNCKQLTDPNVWSNPTKDRMIKRKLCFICDFWQDYVDLVNDKRSIRVDGKHYFIVPNEKGYMRGFGGERFVIECSNGTIVVTRNLWCQGEIPKNFKNKIPDNAKFIGTIHRLTDKELVALFGDKLVFANTWEEPND